MKYLALLLVAVLSGCTAVIYSSEERTLVVVDLHPVGGNTTFAGTLNGVGEAALNREQGSSEDVITGAVDSLTGIPGL